MGDERMAGVNGRRADPAVRHKDHLGPLLYRQFDELQDRVFVAADIEDDQYIACLHVQKSRRPSIRQARKQRHLRAHDLHQRDKVVGKRMGDPATDHIDRAARIGEQARGRVKLGMIDLAQRRLQVLDHRIGKAVQDMRIGRPTRPAIVLGQGRDQHGLDLCPQA